MGVVQTISTGNGIDAEERCPIPSWSSLPFRASYAILDLLVPVSHVRLIYQEVTGAVLVTARKILELAQKAPDLYLRATPEERRGLLAKILSNPVLDGLTVRYELKKPFRLVSEMASSSSWGDLYVEIRTHFQDDFYRKCGVEAREEI